MTHSVLLRTPYSLRSMYEVHYTFVTSKMSKRFGVASRLLIHVPRFIVVSPTPIVTMTGPDLADTSTSDDDFLSSHSGSSTFSRPSRRSRAGRSALLTYGHFVLCTSSRDVHFVYTEFPRMRSDIAMYKGSLLGP